MEINISLRHGPLDIEVQAESDESYRQEILDIASFIEENETVLEALEGYPNPSTVHTDEQDSSTEQIILEGTKNDTDTKQTSSDESKTSGRFASISRRTGVDEGTLESFFDMPDDDDEVPAIIIEEFNEGVEALGDSRMERQARASLMLLYIWEDIRDVEKVYSTDLGDSLHMSGIDPEKMANMYQAFDGDADAYFERHGSGGPYSGVSLTRRGERAAIDEIQEIAGE
ncbi:hypothetical protein RH831_05940 [Halodesulfurarchaeum sp. HSR-GB]|uniref:hypothetical protein n=1 Tax=Halodesulfurarchaeum sp. HSR-GB TaxID=3074077 RepID=UPI00285F4EDA|nr:hypothetical protein [Halodesulfurarchaeum sp. HSR-GB]MDR5656718.1 hypothetical protein [Halodesulfurarchaeum sp. HSR-GB]